MATARARARNPDEHTGGRERHPRGQDLHAPGIIQTGKKQGMQLMDDALIDLSKRGLISAEEAYARAEQKQIDAAAHVRK